MKKLRLGTNPLRLERAALILIVLLAFALRVYRLDAQAIWWDESLSVYRATRDLGTVLANTILIQNVVTTDTVPPLYFLLLHFLVPVFGTTEFAMRFFSLAANVATIPLLYVLARRLLTLTHSPLSCSPGLRTGEGPGVGVIAALLGALSPFYVWYAQEARPYALVLFWSTLAVYALVRAFSIRLSVSPQAIRWVAVYILAAIAALYTHYYAIFLIPFHVVLIAALVWRKQRAWVALPAVPLASAFLLIPLVRSSVAGNVDTGPDFVPFDIILRDLLNSFTVGITVDFAQAIWIDALMLGLFLIGIVAITHHASRITLLAYIFVPVICVVAASYFRPLYQNSRYLIAISPAFYLGVAAGIVALAFRWRILAVPALGVFLVGATISLNNLYFDPRYGKDDHRAWADSLRERVRPGDFLILDSPHTEELFQYYARDLVPWKSLPVLNADSPDADLAVIREAYRKNVRVWFLEMDVSFDDAERRIERLLNQEGVLLDQTAFPATSTEISLSLFVPFLPVVAENTIAHPLDVGFAGNLRLRGYAAPDALLVGRNIIQLFWEIDDLVGEDYAVSLRMVNASGTIVAQWDSVPLGNRAGTSGWKSNTILADAHELPIAAGTPPGPYHLQVVPYHSATGNALGDVVTLGEILVSNVEGQ